MEAVGRLGEEDWRAQPQHRDVSTLPGQRGYLHQPNVATFQRCDVATSRHFRDLINKISLDIRGRRILRKGEMGKDGEDDAGVNREIVYTPVFVFSFSNT